MKNLAFLVSGTALIVGSLATPASAFSFLVEGDIESVGSIDIFGLVEESFDFDFGFSETIETNDFGISDEVVVNSLSDGNVTVPFDLFNLFLPFDFEESLGIEDFDLINYDAALSVDGVGDFGLAFNTSDPDNPSFDLTPIDDSDIDLGICLAATCALSGNFSADLGAGVDLGFFDTSASIELAGMFELSTTPLTDIPPGPGNPSEPGTPDPGTPDPGTPDPGTPEPGTPDPGAPDPGAPDPVSVPEPMTLLGAAIAMAAGAIFTRQS